MSAETEFHAEGTAADRRIVGDGLVWLLQLPEGLTLTDGEVELRGDFSLLLPRLRQGRVQSEMLVKAAKVKGVANPLVVDATAGLGEDSMLLAAAGFRVRMYERDAVIAAMLRDALERAGAENAEPCSSDRKSLADALSRIELREEDSIAALRALSERPDVVLLDPMFPARQKSAAVKKKFQLLHHLEQPCTDEAALLEAAIAAGPRKIVIKRPPKGPYLAGRKPSYSLAGKAVRYDVIAIAR